MLCLEIILFLVLIFIFSVQEIATLWYLAGIYLGVLGFVLLRQEGDILVGFLWVVDLGVGLIFFVFILHFANFLTQKVYFNISSKSSILVSGILVFFVKYLYTLSFPINSQSEVSIGRSFIVSWYDYYDLFSLVPSSDLGVLRETYFLNNSIEFVAINFMLLYGVISAISLSFWVKRVLSRLHVDSFTSLETFSRANSTFLIRTQNLISQQQQTTETRVWKKKSTGL
jgi:hypothetical protein